MRINITAQSPDRDLLVALLNRIVDDVSKPQILGVKERGELYGFTWEIVPDEHEAKGIQEW